MKIKPLEKKNIIPLLENGLNGKDIIVADTFTIEKEIRLESKEILF